MPAVTLTSEKKTYPCTVDGCDKVYARLEYLQRHERKHADIRPFPCSLCDKTFSRSDVLYRHKAKQHPGGAADTGSAGKKGSAATGSAASARDKANPYPLPNNTVPSNEPRVVPNEPTSEEFGRGAFDFVTMMLSGANQPVFESQVTPIIPSASSDSPPTTANGTSSASPEDNQSSISHLPVPSSLVIGNERGNDLFQLPLSSAFDSSTIEDLTTTADGSSTYPFSAFTGMMEDTNSSVNKYSNGAVIPPVDEAPLALFSPFDPLIDYGTPPSPSFAAYLLGIDSTIGSTMAYDEQNLFTQSDEAYYSNNTNDNNNAKQTFATLQNLDIFEPEKTLHRVEMNEVKQRMGTMTKAEDDAFYIGKTWFGSAFKVNHWKLPDVHTMSEVGKRTILDLNPRFGSMLHVPTFRLKEAQGCIAFTSCVIGYPIESVVSRDKCTTLVRAFSRNSASVGPNTNLHTDWNIATVQALLLCNAPAILYGSEDDRMVSFKNLNTIIPIARRTGIFDPFFGHASNRLIVPVNALFWLEGGGRQNLDASWRRWIHIESTRRTAWSAYLLDSHAYIVTKKLNLHPRDMSAFPLPAPDSLWEAPTAEAWARSILTWSGSLTLGDAIELHYQENLSPPQSATSFDAFSGSMGSQLEKHQLGPFAMNCIIVTLLRAILDVGCTGISAEGREDKWIGSLGYLTELETLVLYSNALDKWKSAWDADETCTAGRTLSARPSQTNTDPKPDNIQARFNFANNVGQAPLPDLTLRTPLPGDSAAVFYSADSLIMPELEDDEPRPPQVPMQFSSIYEEFPDRIKIHPNEPIKGEDDIIYCQNALPFYHLANVCINILRARFGSAESQPWAGNIPAGGVLQQEKTFDCGIDTKTLFAGTSNWDTFRNQKDGFVSTTGTTSINLGNLDDLMRDNVLHPDLIRMGM